MYGLRALARAHHCSAYIFRRSAFRRCYYQLFNLKLAACMMHLLPVSNGTVGAAGKGFQTTGNTFKAGTSSRTLILFPQELARNSAAWAMSHHCPCYQESPELPMSQREKCEVRSSLVCQILTNTRLKQADLRIISNLLRGWSLFGKVEVQVQWKDRIGGQSGILHGPSFLAIASCSISPSQASMDYRHSQAKTQNLAIAQGIENIKLFILKSDFPHLGESSTLGKQYPNLAWVCNQKFWCAV